MTVGGVPVLLLAAVPGSDVDQINLQIPFEEGNAVQADNVVNNNGAESVPETTTIGAVPAFFTVDGTAGAFLHADYSLVSAAAPAQAGETVILYAIGLGLMNGAAGTGQSAAGANGVRGTVAVTIGGVPAEVQYAGAAPGFAGLYQLNVVIPAGLSAGPQPITMTLDGAPATGRATIHVR